MKSSLRTFLAGKNPLLISKLRNSITLGSAVDSNLQNESIQELGEDDWYVDVLDDGTAITYCAD
jgi:hypothetical protein